MGAMFRALQNRNYRLWAAGAPISNVGTWMQRVAQDWLVLTVLTDYSGTAVGITTSLQFNVDACRRAMPGRLHRTRWR